MKNVKLSSVVFQRLGSKLSPSKAPPEEPPAIFTPSILEMTFGARPGHHPQLQIYIKVDGLNGGLS